MATTSLSETDISKFYVQNGERGQHGNLFWSVTHSKDSRSHPRIQIADNKSPLRAPFGLTSFGENGRQNLDYNIEDEEIQNFFTALDKWVVSHVAKNIMDFFPKKQPANLLDTYSPLLSQKENFDPLLRTKVNSSCLVFRVENGTHKGTLDDISPGSRIVPVVSVSKIWTMSGRFGMTLVTEALMVWPRREKMVQDIFLCSSDDVDNETFLKDEEEN